MKQPCIDDNNLNTNNTGNTDNKSDTIANIDKKKIWF